MIPEEEDAMLTMAVQVFDAVQDVPLKAQTAMALRAFGLTLDEIAKQMGYAHRSGVKNLLDKYDPKRLSERGDALRRLVFSGMFEKIGFEVLRRIKSEDLENIPLRERVKIAKECADAVQKLNAKFIKVDEREAELLKSLRGDFKEDE